MLQVNCLVFPKPAFYSKSSINKHLVHIPKDSQSRHYYPCNPSTDNLKDSSTQLTSCRSNATPYHTRLKSIIKSQRKYPKSYVPCLYLKGSYRQQKLIIYFHSNAEDLVSCFDFVQAIGLATGRSVLVVQYPGYSVYQGEKRQKQKQKYREDMMFLEQQGQIVTTAEDIQADARKVVAYMKQVVGFGLKDMSVIGRSIGSGPAVYIASIYNIESLILLSPFTSLRSAVKDLYGRLFSDLIAQRFNNRERIKLVQSPCLLIHGIQDTIIPPSHSVTLTKQTKSFTKLKLVPNMKHNSFNFSQDFMLHVKQFLYLLEEQYDIM